MTHENLLITDVDECLLSWVRPFKKWVSDNYDMIYYSDWPTEWDLDKWLHHPDPLKLVKKFNASDNFKWLPPYKMAETYLSMIGEIMPIVAVTSCGENNKQNRLANLRSRFKDVEFVDVICLPPDVTKGECLQQIQLKHASEKYYWVEDNPGNALTGWWLGMETFYMKTSFNKDCVFDRPDYSWNPVNNWKEIHSKLV